MNLTFVNPKLLLPNPWNTNEVGPEGMEKLERSLERHGWVRPVIVRELDSGRLEILGGQHRVEAAVSLGHVEVPVVNLGKIDETRAKEIGLIDNARYGTDDAIALAELIADIGGISEISTFLPFDDTELASLGADVDTNIDDLIDGDEEEKPETKSRSPKTHQMMRFKVPVEDAEMVSEVMEAIMKENGFTESDSLTNAGDALVALARAFRDGVFA